MAYDPKEILTTSVSDKELNRRWKAARERMEEEKIDVLVMQNSNQWLGGYVQWFVDIPARNAYPMTVIFPLNDEMTTITCGGRPPGDLGPPAWTMRGVKNRLTAPYFPSVHYSATYDAELVVKTIKERKDKTVGIVNTAQMSAKFYEYLVKHLSGVKIVDATDMIDELKAIKSEEEIELIKRTCALQDEAMAYAKTIIKPGRKDLEIVADVIHKVTLLGSEEQLVIGGSAPYGIPAVPQKRHYQNRVVREGDQFTLMIEVNGPGGMYAELGRCFFIGDVPAELYDANELCKEAQHLTVSMLKPGVDPKEIWEANNRFLVSKGHLPETRLYAHGQGYDLVERPCIRDDETMKLKKNMNITVHPTIGTKTLWVSLWDNWIITETGPSERLHKTPQEIFPI
ncbi:MAG: Xaa-Pro peptidase family protein [Syntrophorhabdaceae bacterium]|nr:Xaa-Pro peptidase family protein [Syntrophorhabdaceae bacterium]